MNQLYPDCWFDFSKTLDEKHQKNLTFINANNHVMGVPEQDFTHCYGHEINKFNSGLIRAAIEKAIKNDEPFDWENLRFALDHHAKVVKHNCDMEFYK